MPQDRRSFIRRFGAALGSLIVSGSLRGCGPKKGGDLFGAKGEGTTQSDLLPITRTFSAPEWEQVRQCWLDLKTIKDELVQAYREDVDRRKKGIETTKEQLVIIEAIPRRRTERHQLLLSTLVEAGQLEEPVAKHMQVAFEEATRHFVRSMSSCYALLPTEYAPREDLLRQAEMLRTVSADLDPATVAKAQAAITQDVAFFEVFEVGKSHYDWSLADTYKAGNLRASPEALEAARLLTLLFVGTSD